MKERLIIAEIGQNHNGDMELAKELISAAADAGADVAKFQLFDAPALFPPTKKWFDYNCMTQLSRDEVDLLNDDCNAKGIEFMASPFDVERVQWLEDINVKRYKVASRSISDSEMISAIAETGKPYIASLGMWDGERFPNLPGNLEGFLYCISKYPTDFSDLKFSTVDYNDYLGFSDHTIGVSASYIALARGAMVLEKHFTLDKSMEGPDHAGSMTPDELKLIVDFKNDLEKCL